MTLIPVDHCLTIMTKDGIGKQTLVPVDHYLTIMNTDGIGKQTLVPVDHCLTIMTKDGIGKQTLVPVDHCLTIMNNEGFTYYLTFIKCTSIDSLLIRTNINHRTTSVSLKLKHATNNIKEYSVLHKCLVGFVLLYL